MRYIDTNTGKELTEEEERDIEHPYYAKFRRPATRVAETLLSGGLATPNQLLRGQTPEASQRWARRIVPQTPYWAAALPASVAMTAAGVPWWLAVPGAATVGGGTAALTGDSWPRAALETGGAELLGRSVTSGIGAGMKSIAAKPLSRSTSNDVAAALSRVMSHPLGKELTAADLQALSRGENIFDWMPKGYKGPIKALRETFSPANEIFDRKSGLLNQPNLITALEAHRDALTRELGPDEFMQLYNAAQRLPQGTPSTHVGPTSDVPSERFAFSVHPSLNPAHAFRVHLGSTGQYVNAPIWAQPPRYAPSIMTYFAGKPAANLAFGKKGPSGPPPEGTPED